MVLEHQQTSPQVKKKTKTKNDVQITPCKSEAGDKEGEERGNK